MRINLLFFFLLVGALHYAQKPIFTKAKVNAVNVYRSSAELQNLAGFSLPAGMSEVVITNISDDIEEKSLQININNKNVSILSSQFTDDYSSEYDMDKTNPMIKRVTDSITIVENLVSKSNIELEANNKTLELLDKNQTVLVGSNTSNVSQLMQLTEFYKNKRVEISNAINLINKKNTELQKKLVRLKSSLKINSEMEETSSDGVLILKLMSSAAVTVKAEINYLARNASWQPFYEVRGNKLSEPLDIIFKAKIKQDTGLDWKGVKLSLINGRASRKNTAPVLSPWFLNSYKNEEKALVGRVYGVQTDTTAKEQEIEEVVVTAVGFTSVENQFNISFDVDVPYDILGNNQDHLINLKQIKVPAIYKYYAIPKYNNDAFLIAKIKDFNKFNLISAPATVVFENMFIGETNIKPDQTSNELSITLGDDKKISILKELIDDKNSVKIFSSYQEKTYTYDIVVRNNKKDLIDMELKDLIPLSKDDSVKVELLQSDNAEIDKEKGYMTWKVKISPSETKKFRVSYKVRYPKDYSISNLN
ncbi:hypothetical protein CEY12_17945 [Chryseobacterium sp. T16E-39]|uniref:DUF4139 domain-containing protein n=1 Tax=Chryseobacterium sp. T16E-39 TaxID=2015076 RepID=UPI000B5B36B3|nr:DUF4139 domain-containing protein [Chryseobacterium sp. T16E-39]ASK31873.1 hypothetical protein CEY12_17945 [Chryseobacterium sp. T16E-39]